jgi:hypothetical protein
MFPFQSVEFAQLDKTWAQLWRKQDDLFDAFYTSHLYGATTALVAHFRDNSEALQHWGMYLDRSYDLALSKVHDLEPAIWRYRNLFIRYILYEYTAARAGFYNASGDYVSAIIICERYLAEASKWSRDYYASSSHISEILFRGYLALGQYRRRKYIGHRYPPHDCALWLRR